MEEPGAAPSKKAAKKAEAKAKKEAQKALRAAERSTTTAEPDPADDPAKDNYGRATAERPATFSPDAQDINLRSLSGEHVGKTVTVRAWLQNTRMQGAKMAFVELREEGNWAIQGIVMANVRSPEAGGASDETSQAASVISRPMVKWVGAINPESFVQVEATVQRPIEPVKSCRVSDYELHITKCFVIAPAPAVLGMTLAAASRAVANFSDEETKPADPKPDENDKDPEAVAPAASMLTHLDNIVMHKRAPVQQAIAVCRPSLT